MDYKQTPKTWFNRSGGYIIKTVYNPSTGSFSNTTTEYNRLPNATKTTLPSSLLNDSLDWRNVVRENRQKE